jgi:hypothetical protein
MKSPSRIAARGGSLFVALSTVLFCQPSYAASYSGSGTVATMDIADFTTFGADTNWFSLTGVVSLGNCGNWTSGSGTLVLIRMKDDAHGQQMYATVLAAMLAGTSVTVYIDDAYVDPQGHCYAQQVFLGVHP